MKSDAEGIALHFLVSKETKGFEKGIFVIFS